MDGSSDVFDNMNSSRRFVKDVDMGTIMARPTKRRMNATFVCRKPNMNAVTARTIGRERNPAKKNCFIPKIVSGILILSYYVIVFYCIHILDHLLEIY